MALVAAFHFRSAARIAAPVPAAVPALQPVRAVPSAPAVAPAPAQAGAPKAAWCRGAAGEYVEDLIANLQGNKAAYQDGPMVERRISNLKVWLKANQRIGNTVGLASRVLVCNLAGLNAFVTSRNEPVRVHIQAVDILGADEDAIAALLGHEYAHLALNHKEQGVEVRKQIARSVARKYAGVWQRSSNPERVVDQAVTAMKGEWSAASIQNELAADDLGISYLGKSGYSPDAFDRLALIGKAIYGNNVASAFPSHPNFVERRLKARDRVDDEIFDQTAAGLAANENFSNLSSLVEDWMDALPGSANATYYKAIVLRHLRSRQATETMEYALLPTRTPGLSQRADDVNEAWLWLCVQLYREGYVVESAYCGSMQLRRDQTLWDRFQSQTFQGRMAVNLSATGEPALGTRDLSFIRKPDGKKLITNNAATAAYYGVAEPQFTPAWRPIRFKACAETKAKPCPVWRDEAE
jgi:hypothetical protein